jgi:transcriptional regulator with XRE-family HTH domain
MDPSTTPVSEWLRQLSARLVRHRLNRDLSQADLARRAGISLRTLARFEASEPVQLGSFLRLLIALDLGDRLEHLLPEVPESPIQQLERAGKVRRRASRRRDRRESDSTSWTWGDDQ